MLRASQFLRPFAVLTLCIVYGLPEASAADAASWAPLGGQQKGTKPSSRLFLSLKHERARSTLHGKRFSPDRNNHLGPGAAAAKVASPQKSELLKQNACADCSVGSIQPGQEVSGNIPTSGCALDDGSFIDIWRLDLPEACAVDVALRSDQFDPYLFLLNSDCQVLAQNDDCDGFNSCLTASLSAGAYFLGANSFSGGERGSYDLSILPCACALPPAPQAPEPAHGARRVPEVDLRLSWDVAGGAGELEAKVIYGSDDRLELYEVSDPRVLALADATTVLVEGRDLSATADGGYWLPSRTFEQEIRAEFGLPLCSSERFRDQPSPGFCSGFLVAPDLVATAGHCVDAIGSCDHVAVIFGFRMLDEETPRLLIPAEDVYFCDAVIDRVVTPRADWAVIRLDRPVEAHTSLAIRKEGRVPDNAPLLVIGHPMGLPAKVAGGAHVRDNSPQGFFVANLDTYGGNSGSPVVNAATFTVEGVLVRGEQDLEVNGTCMASHLCPDEGCTGEDATRTTEFKHLLGGDAVTYEVFFGRCGDMEPLGTTDQLSWDLDASLEPGTDYCWQIVVRNECGSQEGPVWQFSTNYAPLVQRLRFTMDEDVPLEGRLVAEDPDGDDVRFEVVENGSLGLLSFTDPATGEFRYTPNPNANGPDRVSYSVSDGDLASRATVRLFLEPVNDRPEAVDTLIVVTQGDSVQGVLEATDIDGDPLTFQIVREPTEGSVVITDASSGAFTYRARTDASNRDSFRFKASDPIAVSRAGVVSVEITAAGGGEGGGGGGGCTMQEDAEPDLTLLLMAALAAFHIASRRRRRPA